MFRKRILIPSGILAALLICTNFLTGCGGNRGDGPVLPTDGQLELTTFHPNYGKYLEKVILQGKGFKDPSRMRVYFNHAKAAVIGVSNDGRELYVTAPRLPGDTCIISVTDGKDSLSYADTFDYTVSTTVSTVMGNGTRLTKTGPLSEAQTAAYYCAVDANENVFVTERSVNGDGGSYGTASIYNGVGRIDLENNEFTSLVTGLIPNVLCVDPITQIVMVPTERSVTEFITFDPKEMWGPRFRNFNCDWTTSKLGRPAHAYKHSMVVNPADGAIYTRFYYGQVVKIDPVTFDAVVVCDTPQGDSFGLTFRPTEPNHLYVACFNNFGAGFAGAIGLIDLNQEDPTMVRLTSGIKGHRDGKISEARFNNPCQMFSDNEGNIYVADMDNHCIRRITPENQVETVLGVPGTKGWKDGSKDEALFNNPRGIGIAPDGSVYVADFGNGRIRKLSIN